MPDHAASWDRHDFARLWSAQATGLVGQQFSVLAVPLIAIITLHASASTVALLVACFNLPTLLFGLFVGVPLDRWRRRPVLIWCDIGRALLIATVPLGALMNVLSLGQMFVLGIVVGTLDLLWMTAYRSYVPAVVPDSQLSKAYAMVGASDAITRMVAPSIGGSVIQLVGAPAGISVTSACYFASGLFNSRIRAEERSSVADAHEPVWQAFRGGVAYVRRHRVVRIFALSEATYILFWAAGQSVVLVFLNRNLGLGPGLIGLTYTAGAIGGVVSAAVARRIGNRLGPNRTIRVGSALRSLGLALLPVVVLSGPFAIGVLLLTRLVNSFGWTLWDVHRETRQQRLIDERFRGRTNSVILFLSGASLTAGSALGAGIVALAGVVATVVITGIASLAAICWLFGLADPAGEVALDGRADIGGQRVDVHGHERR